MRSSGAGTARSSDEASEQGGRTRAEQQCSSASRSRCPTSTILGPARGSLSVDPRWEPGAGNPLAGFCPGGGPKGPSLPGQGSGIFSLTSRLPAFLFIWDFIHVYLAAALARSYPTA